MSTNWDLAAYDRDSQLALVVEVKSKLGATPQWAAQLRRNILAHGTFANARFLLIALPDHFYLWKDARSNHEPLEPTFSIDARPILRPYFEQSGVTSDQISGQSLEFMIASWLNDVIRKRPDEIDASQQWLIDSGLHEAVMGGTLEYRVAV